VAVSPQMRLIEDNPASISLLDIYKQGCARVGLEHDSPVLRYYERLAAVQVQFEVGLTCLNTYCGTFRIFETEEQLYDSQHRGLWKMLYVWYHRDIDYTCSVKYCKLLAYTNQSM
jgi:hypothetical protein